MSGMVHIRRTTLPPKRFILLLVDVHFGLEPCRVKRLTRLQAGIISVRSEEQKRCENAEQLMTTAGVSVRGNYEGEALTSHISAGGCRR